MTTPKRLVHHRTSTILTLALALLTALAIAALQPQATYADELTLYTCHTPAGAAVGNDGWTGWSTGENGLTYQDTCANSGQGVLHLEVGTWGYPDLARVEWLFSAPAWATIANYTFQIANSYTLPYAGAGEGQAFIHASDESNQVYDYRKLANGAQGATTVSRTPPDTTTGLSLNASCDGEAGRCASGAPVSYLNVSSARIVLTDSSIPTVSNIGGTFLSLSTQRGNSEVTFDAKDEGPGIYAAHFVIDGKEEPAVTLDTNNGWCENLGQTTDGTRAFSHVEPCARELSSSLALNTAQLADGTHSVKLIVEDASGNSTTGWTGTITTDNAPVSSSSPALEASNSQPVVGTELVAVNGTWETPAGAGPITYTGQWLRCNAEGGDCQPVTDATSSTYTVNNADTGHTLRYQVTAKDNAGFATADSPASAIVPNTQQNSAPPGPGGPLPGPGLSAPGGSSSGSTSIMLGMANGTNASEAAFIRLGVTSRVNSAYKKSNITVRGRLLAPEGQPIAGATLAVLQQVATEGAPMRKIGVAHTASDGSFTANIPMGPSRLIRLAYRAFANETTYAFTRTVLQNVRAGVTLRIAPTRIGPYQEIKLAGQVLGGYLGRLHPVVELEVKYLGSWQVFYTVRCKGGGVFKTRYRFKGATGLFPFRARVRASPGRPYTLGYSPTHDVRAE